jgi:hypothetical protein
MAFGDFPYPGVLRTFGLTLNLAPDLFAGVPEVPASATLRDTLSENTRLATTLHTEAGRAMWMVAPVLSHFWWRYRGRIGVYSGLEFSADPGAGLTGFCDFVIGRGPQQPRIVAPVLVIFEAKRDNIMDGLGQCVAAMVGAVRFNQREDTPVDQVYGAVTTGSLWRFLRLGGTVLTLDLVEYTINQVDRLLGILTHIVGPVPGTAAA